MKLLKNTIVKNALSLTSVQFISYLAPLIAIPYITRTIGVEKYGIVEEARSFIFYFTVLVNYGFDYWASREVAKNITNEGYKRLLFWNVFYTKLLLIIVSFIAFYFIIMSDPSRIDDKSYYFIAFSINIGFVFYPMWFFQGIQKIHIITKFDIIFKIITTALIFVFVKSHDDAYFVNLSYALYQIGIGIIGFLIAYNKFNLVYSSISINEIIKLLKSSAAIFTANLFMAFYGLVGISFLKNNSSEQELGYFMAAYKLIFIFHTLFTKSISKALYPHFAGISNNINLFKLTIIKYLKLIIPFTLIISITLFFFAEDLIVIVNGNHFKNATIILQTLCPLIVLMSINDLIIFQGLLNINNDSIKLYLYLFFGVLSISLNYYLIPLYGATGLASIMIFNEFVLAIVATSVLYYFIEKKKKENV